MERKSEPVATAGQLIDARRAADILGKSVKTLEKWRKDHKGPPWYQPEGKGGSIWYLEHEVRAYVLGGAL